MLLLSFLTSARSISVFSMALKMLSHIIIYIPFKHNPADICMLKIHKPVTIHIFSPHTSINFSYIQKGCSNRYSPVVAAELSLLHVTVLDSGFAALRFHKCALMVNNFIEFAHFCQYIFFIHTDVI